MSSLRIIAPWRRGDFLRHSCATHENTPHSRETAASRPTINKAIRSVDGNMSKRFIMAVSFTFFLSPESVLSGCVQCA